MDILGLIIYLVSGLVSGNVTGAAMKDKTLGAIGNSIAGLVGGAAGGYILQAVGILNTLGMGDVTIGSVLGRIGTSFVGGGVLTAIACLIKGAVKKS